MRSAEPKVEIHTHRHMHAITPEANQERNMMTTLTIQSPLAIN